MNELTRRLRDSNPYRDGALPPEGEEALQKILNSPKPSVDPTATRSAHHMRRYPLLLAGAFVLVLAVAFTMTTWLRHDGAMAVTPQPLTITPSSLSVDDLRAQLDASKTEVGVEASQPGSLHQGWYFQFDDASPTSRYIQAQITSLEVAPDGSGVARIYAGAPMDENGIPLTSTPEGAEEQGTLILDHPLEPGDALGQFSAVPPETPEEVRPYLDQYLNPEGAAFYNDSAADYAMAGITVLELWTLSSEAEKSLISVILNSDGVEILGTTRDRLGRDGVVLGFSQDATEQEPITWRIIIDPTSWRILASESINILGDTKYQLPPDTVIGYTLWGKPRQ